jgi:hypothetical protein
MLLRNLYPGICCVSTPIALPVAFSGSSELASAREADEPFYLPTLCIAEIYRLCKTTEPIYGATEPVYGAVFPELP